MSASLAFLRNAAASALRDAALASSSSEGFLRRCFVAETLSSGETPATARAGSVAKRKADARLAPSSSAVAASASPKLDASSNDRSASSDRSSSAFASAASDRPSTETPETTPVTVPPRVRADRDRSPIPSDASPAVAASDQSSANGSDRQTRSEKSTPEVAPTRSGAAMETVPFTVSVSARAAASAAASAAAKASSASRDATPANRDGDALGVSRVADETSKLFSWARERLRLAAHSPSSAPRACAQDESAFAEASRAIPRDPSRERAGEEEAERPREARDISRFLKAPPSAASIADATRRAVASGASPGAASATAAAAMRAATAATSTAFAP